MGRERLRQALLETDQGRDRSNEQLTQLAQFGGGRRDFAEGSARGFMRARLPIFSASLTGLAARQMKLGKRSTAQPAEAPVLARIEMRLSSPRQLVIEATVTVMHRNAVTVMLLDTVTRLEDLRVPPGNRLEALGGDRRGQHSIRVNEQWRLCFIWRDGDVYDVEFVDYH